MMTNTVQTLANDLHEARISGSAVPPITQTERSTDIAAAYAIQREGIRLRLAAGEHIVGAKLGLTSPAKQREVGFYQPVYSWLTDAMRVTGNGLAIDLMRAPRVEPELALVLGRTLEPEGETPETLLQAIIAVAPA